MIACRSLFRVDFPWKLTNTCVICPSLRNLQRCSFYPNLRIHIGEGLRGGMERKKQKMVSRVWRKVSTQSSGQQEYMVKDVRIDSGNLLAANDDEKYEVESQVNEVYQSVSSHCSIIQHERVELGDELQNNDVGGSEGKQIASVEKHSVSVDAMSSTQKHSIVVQVGASLIRFVKGKSGATQKKIEDKTGVKITFPSSRKEDSIVIEGNSIESVTEASKRIQIIIDEVVKSPSLDYSHFVSLPLAIHSELVDKLVEFQNSILGTCDSDQNEILNSDSGSESSDEEHGVQNLGRTTEVAVKLKANSDTEYVNVDITSIPLVSYPAKTSEASASELKNSKLSELGIEKSIFIKPKTFHLTVLMLKLWNKERVETAADVLQNVSPKVVDALEGRPITIRLKGLECMRGSFAKARVLYAPVEEIGGEGRLLRACQVITEAFVEAGLVLENDAQQKLKLHATVMNARHRKRKKRTKKADCFDARSIVDQYGSEEWGEYLIREVHLSQRFAFDENGYYRCCASIPFPEEMQAD